MKPTIKEYLQQRYTQSTATSYLREINSYLKYNPGAETAAYPDVMNYIGDLRKKYTNPRTINRILQAVKKYYNYLLHTGQRKDHPCKHLHLRDKQSRDIQLQDLFKTEELEMLLETKERYQKVKIKNRAVISLLIYQGLLVSDIVRLTLEDINLEEGTIYIKSGAFTNSRTLKLKARQILLLHKYITEARPQLITEDTGALIINMRGTREKGEGIQYIIERCRHLFPARRLNSITIRQSVITNLLKQGKDLRLVQAYAGHKTPSATERYKQTQVEQLRQQIGKYHPLQ